MMCFLNECVRSWLSFLFFPVEVNVKKSDKVFFLIVTMYDLLRLYS